MFEVNNENKILKKECRIGFEARTNSKKVSCIYKLMESDYSSDGGNTLDMFYLKYLFSFN